MKVIFILLISCFAFNISAQQPDSTQVIRMIDGSTYVGTIESQDSNKIILNSKVIGSLTLKVIDVDTIYWSDPQDIMLPVEGIAHSDEWYAPPIKSINFLTETALPLDQGELYYQNILLFGQKIGYGVTDRFTINTGLELYSPLYESGPPSLLVAPKYTFTDGTSSFQFAMGTNLLFPSNGRTYDFGGTVYGVVTIGNVNNNISIGTGLIFSEDGIYEYPIIQVSAQARLSKKIGLVYDSLSGSYDYDEFINASTLMLRFISKTFVIDFGGLFSFDESFIIPMANFAIRL